jgi:hypothetical protein
MEKINLYLPEPDLKVLRGLAKKQDVPVAELVRRAVHDYLSRLQEAKRHAK